MRVIFKSLKEIGCGLFFIALIIQLSGCGTLLYPERKGQRGGHVDAGVAVLDGVGLLFFLIPGVIAYAVDFSNGTIYLPGTYKTSMDFHHIREVRFDPKHITLSGLEKILKDQTGCGIRFGQKEMKVVRLTRSSEVLLQFSQVETSVREARLVLNR